MMFAFKYMFSFLVVLVLTTSISHAQVGNTLVLKEKGRTIQSWIEKDCITFRFSNTQWIEGKIKTILKDSLLINMYRAQQSPTVFGGFRVDTTWLGFLKISIHEISGMPQSRYKSGLFTNGILFKLGSGAYMFCLWIEITSNTNVGKHWCCYFNVHGICYLQSGASDFCLSCV